MLSLHSTSLLLFLKCDVGLGEWEWTDLIESEVSAFGTGQLGSEVQWEVDLLIWILGELLSERFHQLELLLLAIDREYTMNGFTND